MFRGFACLASILILPGPAEGAAGQDPTPERITPVAELAEPFSRVRGIRELADGRILVADQLENAVYMADLVAQTRTQIGRNGAGPEEYNQPVGLHVARADSSYLLDISNGRVSVLDANGRVARSEPMFGPDRSIPTAADTLGNQYWDNVTTVRLAKRTDPGADRALILRRSPSGAIDTVGALTIPGGVNPVPFHAWDGWAVGRDGRVVMVRNRIPFRLVLREPDGTIIEGPTTPFESVRVTGADREAYMAGNRSGGGVGGVSTTGGGGSRPREPEFPDRFPPARGDRVWVAADGRTWVQRHQHLDADGLVYDVFDRTGVRVARYRLPAGSEVVGFGQRGLYAVRVDEVGLQWLQRFAVSMPARQRRP
jgi:hypothetical protein